MSNLNIDLWVEGQDDPQDTVNAGIGTLDAALTEFTNISLASGNYTFVGANEAVYHKNIKFNATGVATGGRTITVPAHKRMFLLKSAAANTNNISLIRGSTTLTIEPGAEVLVYTDGTTNGLTATHIVGVPAGGATGEVLTKNSGTNFDYSWAAQVATAGVPNGGTTGQVLGKLSVADGDFNWIDQTGAGVATDFTSYSNPGGIDDRTALITVTKTATSGSFNITGALNNLVDGLHTDGTGDGIFFAGGADNGYIEFDFFTLMAARQCIDEFVWLQTGSQTHGTWYFDATDDHTWATFTSLLSSFTLGGVINWDKRTFTNTNFYKYYRLKKTAGSTDSGPWLHEIFFRIKPEP